MNLRHIPNHKTSKRVYQILFVVTLTVLSSLFFTCDNANTTGGGIESDRAPAAPSNVRAAAGDGEITVTWEDPADTGILEGVKATITGFKIYYSEKPIDTAKDTPIEFTDLTKDRRVPIPGLTNGTSYNIAVSTVTGAGEGNLSAAVTAVPGGGPTELSIVSYGETEIGLTWNEVADSIKYRVYYSKTANFDITTAAFMETQDGSTTALSVTSLDSGTPYYFKVTAFIDTVESAASSEEEAYTNGVPGEPSNIKAATTAVGEITVTWDEPSPGYSDGLAASVSYKVYHKTDSLTETDLDSLSPAIVDTGLSHVLTGLQEDSSYFVTVVAYNDIGDSAVPASVEATALGANRTPSAPASVTIDSSTETEITLSWTAPADTGLINGDGTTGTITAYSIYYSETQGFTIDGNTAKKEVDNTTPTTTAAIDNLNSKTQYYFKVSAANATGSGNASSEAAGYTRGGPGAPTNVAADPGITADSEVTLSWDAPVDTGIEDSTGTAGTITAYKVYYADSSITDLSDTGLASETSAGTSKTITGLSAGTRYYFKVTAVNGIGEGTASVEADTYTNGVPGEPLNIQAVTTEAGKITVTWDAPSPGYYDGSAASLSYKVYHKTNSLTEADLENLSPATVDTGRSHVLTGIQAGTYYVTVIAVNNFGSSAMPTSVEAAAFGDDRPPGAPTSVTITSSTENGIVLSWTAPGDMGIINGDGTPGSIIGYEVYYSKTANFTIGATGVTSQSSDTNSISFTSLDSGTRYYFKVSAANEDGSGVASAEVDGYTTSRPGAPTNAVADPGTTADSEVTLSWDAPVDKGIKDSTGAADTITEYKVYYADSSITDLSDTGLASETSAGTSKTITGLSSGTRYYFRVAALNGTGEGTASVEADTYTNGVPGEPLNIRAATTAAGEITVTWDAPSPGYYDGSAASLNYKVYHKTDSLAEADLENLSPATVDTGLSYVLTGIQAGTYFVTVIAVNDFGSSAMPTSVEAAAFEADRPPGAPTSVTINSSTENGITLSWTAPGDMGIINGDGTPGTIKGYEVYYFTAANFAIDDTGVKSQTATTTSFSFSSLDSGTRYYFKVSAANDSGSGAASEEVDGYTTSRPGAPTNAAADPGTTADSEVTLSWDAPVDKGIKDSTGAADTITEYKVYYADSSITDLSDTGLASETSAGTSKTITGLSAGTRYYFRVVALNGTGEGTASVEADTYTNGVPDAPSNIQAATTAVKEITVTWDAPSPGYYDGSAASLSYKVYHQIGSLAEADLKNLSPATVDTGRSHVLTGLQEDTTYYVTVIAVNVFGSSAMPTSVEAAPFGADRPPGAPTSVTITSSTETGITLSWMAPGDMGIINGDGTPGTIKGYEIYYSKTAGFTIGAGVDSKTTGNTNSISLTSLDSGTQYYFKVTAANDSGSGNASIEAAGYTTSKAGAPTNVAADPGTAADNEVTLTWDAPAEKGIKDSVGTPGTITGYRVYYAASSFSDLVGAIRLDQPSTGTTETITGLTPGTQYYFRVTADNGTGEGAASSEADTYTNSLPSTPTNIQVSKSGAGELTITWDESSSGYYNGSESPVSSYRVYYQTGNFDKADLPGLTPKTVDAGSERKQVLTGLQGGSIYYIAVIAVNDFGGSVMPATLLATPSQANRAPGNPASVTIVSSTETEITLSWKAPVDTGIINGDGTTGTITGYTIYYSENPAFIIDEQTAKSEVGKTTTTATIGSLNPGTLYIFQVTAENEASMGEPTFKKNAYTTSPPDAPTNVAAVPVTTADTEVTLTWNAPVDRGIKDSAGAPGSITAYKVYYATSAINDVNAATEWSQTPTGTSETITGLNSGTQYYFKVAAVNSIGEGAPSSEADTYTNSLPGEPTSIQAASKEAGKITVTWEAPSSGYYNGSEASLSYKVYYRADSLADTDLPSLTPEAVNTGLSTVLTGLPGGSTYYVTVIAVNAFGDSAMPTSVATTIVEADRPPGAPTFVNIDSSTETEIALSWLSPDDIGIVSGSAGTIMGYEVYYSKTANFAINEGVKSPSITSNSISLTSLDSGTQYYFKVTAANEDGSGAASAEIDGYTTSRPGAPTNVAANPGTTANDEVTLSWDAPGDKGIKDSGGAADTISEYRVYHAASPITDLGVLTGVNVQGESHKITGLNAGTRYYFKVAALNSIGEGSASVETDTYTNGVPGEPLNIRAVATTDAGEITVTWDEPSPGYYDGSAASVSYEVYHKTDSLAETDLPGLTPATVTGLSHVLTGLQAGTYYFTVIAVNDFGSSAMPTSVEAAAFGNDRPPGAPTSVTIDSSTENGITLFWMAPADTGIEGGSGAKGTIKDYAVYYSKTPNFAIGDTGVNSKTADTTSYSLTSLDSGTQYYFKVTAANATGSGNASAEASGYTTSKPGAPTNVKADPGTTADSEVTLTWDAPVDGGIADSSNTPTPLNYKVYYAESTITDLSGGGVTGVDAQGTPHKITGLTPGTQYYFRVMANNGIGEGTVSLEADTYTNSLPGEPTDIQAVQGVESLTVSWTAPSAGYAKGSTGVLSYKLYHSTADITPDTDLTALTETEVTSGTTAALSSLTGGTPYSLIVIANNGYGDSTRPTAISAVPWEANRPPGAPTSVTIDSSTETGIDLSWTAPNDTGIIDGDGTPGTILGYEVYYSKTAGFTIAAATASTSTNTNSISFSSLDSGTRYYFKVTAANDSGSGTASEEANGYTISRPDAPTGVNAYPVVTFRTEIEVTWNAPAVKGIAAADGTAGTLSKYRMYYSTSPITDVNAEGVTGVDTQGTSYKITSGLTSGTRYYFKVTAFNSIGEGAASSEVYTYTDAPPGEPDNVVASSYGLWGDAAMVRWEHPTNSGYYGGQRLDRPAKYRVYWAESTGTIQKDQGNYRDVAGDQTSKDIGGLTPDTEYIFAVEAFTFDTLWPKGRSSLSDVDSFTPFQLVPDAPTNLRSIQADKEGTAIWLKWDAPAYTGRYLDGTEVPLSDIQYKIVIMPTIYPDPNEKPDSLSATAVGATSILLSHAAGTIDSDSHFVPGVVYGFEIKPELISSSAEGKGTGSIGGDVWKAPVTLRAGSPAHTDSYIGNEDVSGVRQPSFGSPNGALAISPDGKSLYLVSTTGGGTYQAGTLLVFDRDEDGIITLRKEYRSRTSEGNDDGLRRPRDVLVSPDGKNVYLVGDGDWISGSPDTGATLVVFSRYDDGSLNRMRVFFNGKEGVNGMGNASALAISPDGESIYVAGPEDNALAIFARDTSTGGLTYSGMVQRADDLTEVEDVAVSTDGRNVYAVGPGFLAIFDRDSSGGLTYRSALKQGVSGVEGLENSTDVAVSPDGKNVYVSSDSSTVSDGVTTFTRSADGGLTYDKHLVNDHSIDIDVSPDGQYVYAISDSFLRVYERAAGDGSLTYDSIFVPQETIDDTDPKQTAVRGSNQGNAVVVSPDNKNIYVFTYAPNIILDKNEDGEDIIGNGVVLTFVRFDITY